MGIMGIYVRTSVETEGTSIEQQKDIGIKFASKNGFEYQIYEDVGKSGFKIENDENPFKHRKGLTKLISHIENKTVDKVWVYEHSRLSRNQHASYVLFNIFEKHNTTIFEKDKRFDMGNPQNKMIQGILTQIAEYERCLIVGRTTRGLHDSFNRRGRGFNFIYGYRKDGRSEAGYMRWIPVQSELENVKYAFKSLLDGKAVKAIAEDIFKDKNPSDKEMVAFYRRLIRIFKQYAYTGCSLNTDGLEILNQYKNLEISDISILQDKKYWLKSIPYPMEIVSIEDWIKAMTKMQAAKITHNDYKTRRADTEILTGIIECPICEMKYYLYNGGKYKYYKHFSNKNCGQKPKSFKIEKMNNLFETFFFYFLLVYDDTRSLIEESQRLIKISQLELREKIKTLETENRKFEKQIGNFQSIYEETTDAELMKMTLIKEKELNAKKEKNADAITGLKCELEELNQKFEKDKLELTFHDVKQTVLDFFENMPTEEKRTALIKTIKKCLVFGKHILIDAGKQLFVLNTDSDYRITDEMWNQFRNDENFKENFLGTPKLAEALKDDESFQKLMKSPEKKLISNYYAARRLGELRIFEHPLHLDGLKADMKERLAKLGITYELSDIERVVSFTDL